jgi:opacity protein-like surface antigen
MSTFAIAGGDIAPVEPVIETPMVEESTPGNFYLGLAYGMANVESTDSETFGSITATTTVVDIDYSTVMLQAGYKFNPYIALEGRYWFGLENSYNFFNGATAVDASIDSWGVYVKPQYPITESFDVYALLGYANSDITVNNGPVAYNPDSVDGFSWGLGADYFFTDNVAVFVDYVNMYDDTVGLTPTGERTTSVETVNFGVTYQF